MNLPEPDLLGIYVVPEIYYDARSYVERYGSECYAKGRADLLKEIGEPVAYRYWNAGFESLSFNENDMACVGMDKEPIYVFPKEKP